MVGGLFSFFTESRSECLSELNIPASKLYPCYWHGYRWHCLSVSSPLWSWLMYLTSIHFSVLSERYLGLFTTTTIWICLVDSLSIGRNRWTCLNLRNELCMWKSKSLPDLSPFVRVKISFRSKENDIPSTLKPLSPGVHPQFLLFTALCPCPHWPPILQRILFHLNSLLSELRFA